MYPNDEKPGCCNGGCWLMCGAACCHLHWLVALFKRGDMRNKFDIKGDGCTDCLVSAESITPQRQHLDRFAEYVL